MYSGRLFLRSDISFCFMSWHPRSPGGLLQVLSGPRSRRSLSAMAVAAPTAAAQQSKEFVQQAHGFKLVQQQFVREYDSHVLMYKHEKTGAGKFKLLDLNCLVSWCCKFQIFDSLATGCTAAVRLQPPSRTCHNSPA
jgi:hypothetical protein